MWIDKYGLDENDFWIGHINVAKTMSIHDKNEIKTLWYEYLCPLKIQILKS
jgi:hypothetical protein